MFVPGIKSRAAAAAAAAVLTRTLRPPSSSPLLPPPVHNRRSLFFHREMELSLIGLQNAGKSSLVNVLTTGAFHDDMIPTVGFNMRKVTKGAVTIKMWDLGGQVCALRPPPPLSVCGWLAGAMVLKVTVLVRSGGSRAVVSGARVSLLH